MIKSERVRVLLVLVIGIGTVATLVVFFQKRSGYYRRDTSVIAKPSPSQSIESVNSTLAATPTATLPEAPTGAAVPSPTTPQASYVGTLKLVVPVAGVTREQLRDTFSDSRSEGRLHDAIDIPAAQGTPVLAAIDGEIIKLFQSDRGGTTVYQLSSDKKLVFYYAHLQRYAEELYEGKFVRQGEVIAYVGDTGNAGPTNYHLHFSISIVADPKRYWEGANINPYPLLRESR